MKKKPVASSQKSEEKPLTIIVTVLPPKRGLRTMIVSAAREGEMPLVLGGPFADRHYLLDQAYAAVLKREPQVVTIMEPKVNKPKFITAGSVEEDEPGNREPDEDAEQTDQLVDVEPSPRPSPSEGEGAEEELPAIEGDDAPDNAGEIEKFEAQLHETAADLSDISDADEDGQTRGSAPTGGSAPTRGTAPTDDGAEVGDGEQD